MSALLPEIETKSLLEIEQFQEKKLRDLLSYVCTNSKFFQSRFKETGIEISDIKTLDDLKKIPVTTKDDLYNFNNDFRFTDKFVYD